MVFAYLCSCSHFDSFLPIYGILSRLNHRGKFRRGQIQLGYWSRNTDYNGLTPFFIRFYEPRLVVTEKQPERFPTDENPPSYWFGWKLHNSGRRTAKNVTVKVRFVLWGFGESVVDKEFIVIGNENFLPPSGHQPEFEINLRYKEGETNFFILIERKDVAQNITERNYKWEPLPTATVSSRLKISETEMRLPYKVILTLEALSS